MNLCFSCDASPGYLDGLEFWADFLGEGMVSFLMGWFHFYWPKVPYYFGTYFNHCLNINKEPSSVKQQMLPLSMQSSVSEMPGLLNYI